MEKRKIRITEGDIRRMVTESVKRILREYRNDDLWSEINIKLSLEDLYEWCEGQGNRKYRKNATVRRFPLRHILRYLPDVLDLNIVYDINYSDDYTPGIGDIDVEITNLPEKFYHLRELPMEYYDYENGGLYDLRLAWEDNIKNKNELVVNDIYAVVNMYIQDHLEELYDKMMGNVEFDHSRDIDDYSDEFADDNDIY